MRRWVTALMDYTRCTYAYIFKMSNTVDRNQKRIRCTERKTKQAINSHNGHVRTDHMHIEKRGRGNCIPSSEISLNDSNADSGPTARGRRDSGFSPSAEAMLVCDSAVTCCTTADRV